MLNSIVCMLGSLHARLACCMHISMLNSIVDPLDALFIILCERKSTNRFTSIPPPPRSLRDAQRAAKLRPHWAAAVGRIASALFLLEQFGASCASIV